MTTTPLLTRDAKRQLDNLDRLIERATQHQWHIEAHTPAERVAEATLPTRMLIAGLQHARTLVERAVKCISTDEAGR